MTKDKKIPEGAPGKFPGKRPPLDIKTIKRLLTYFKKYQWKMLFVFICIVLSTVASVASSLFIKTLIDDYIFPLIGVENPSYLPLLGAIGGMAVLYLCGILSSLFYNRTMATVTHSILDDISLV